MKFLESHPKEPMNIMHVQEKSSNTWIPWFQCKCITLWSCFRFTMSVTLWFPIGNSSTLSYVWLTIKESRVILACLYRTSGRFYMLQLILERIMGRCWLKLPNIPRSYVWCGRWISCGKSKSNRHNKSKATSQLVMCVYFLYRSGPNCIAQIRKSENPTVQYYPLG